MTISSTVNRNSTAGDGVVTAFTFPYLFLANDDLKVILVVDSTGVETTQTITTHYTVTGAGVAAGGTVTMVTAPASGETLVIIREEQFTQGLDLVENDPFPSDLVEQQFDTLTMLAQQSNTEISRSMKLSSGDTTGVNTTLPTPVALKTFRWNAGLTALEQTDDPAVSATAAAASAAAALVSEGLADTDATATAADAVSTAADVVTTAASEAAAAASASAAAASAGSGPYTTVTILTTGIYNLEIINSRTYYVCDTSGGNITINLPLIGADEGTTYGFQKSSALNAITINRDGTDTINGAISYTVSADTEVVQFIADDNAPDNWIANIQSQTIAGNGLSKTGSTIALKPVVVAAIALGDETTAIAAGTSIVTFHAPVAFTLSDVVAGLTTAQTSGTILTFDINEAGTSILSTKLTVDNTEDNSTTAATAPVLSDTAIAAGAKLTVDVDQIGDGTAIGAKIYLVGYPT